MTAIVTGGASGIGAATVSRLRAAGHDVVSWDRTGGDIQCDISDPESVSAALESTVAGHGVPDRLVACAGVGASGQLVDYTVADWQRVIDTNLTGTWLTLRAVAAAMIGGGAGGSIVAVSSISGTVADRDMGAYCVSKAGVEMLTRCAIDAREAKRSRSVLDAATRRRALLAAAQREDLALDRHRDRDGREDRCPQSDQKQQEADPRRHRRRSPLPFPSRSGWGRYPQAVMLPAEVVGTPHQPHRRR